MAIFILLFGLKLILSAIFIVGVYLITRGEVYVHPDGYKEWKGKIFSFWSRFLQQHTTKKVYYRGDEWYKKLNELLKFIFPEKIIEILDTGIVIQRMSSIEYGLFKSFCASNDILFTIREYGSGSLISVYKEEKIFKVPFLISAPLGECITCMSSFWGSLCFWFWYFIGDEFLQSMPTISIVGLCIFFCISLSWLNEYIFNINHKLKN